MIKLGDTIKGIDIGRVYYKYIWHACIDCGKERWVAIVRGLAESPRCGSCAKRLRPPAFGFKAPRWKGGKIKTTQGYVLIYLHSDDFSHPMTTVRNYVLEHRLVMAKSLGRCLHSWEIVHHKNHIRDDNRFENLQLVTDDRHKQISLLESKVQQLQNRILELETENILLRNPTPATAEYLHNRANKLKEVKR